MCIAVNKTQNIFLNVVKKHPKIFNDMKLHVGENIQDNALYHRYIWPPPEVSAPHPGSTYWKMDKERWRQEKPYSCWFSCCSCALVPRPPL